MPTPNRPQPTIRRGQSSPPDSKWERHRARLLELREHFLPHDEKNKRPATEVPRSSNGSAAVRFDNYDQHLALALLAHEQNPLQEIDAALRRMQEGVYGICERTGAAIDPSRLNALPWARSCSRAERRQRPGHLAHH